VAGEHIGGGDSELGIVVGVDAGPGDGVEAQRGDGDAVAAGVGSDDAKACADDDVTFFVGLCLGGDLCGADQRHDADELVHEGFPSLWFGAHTGEPPGPG